MESNTRPSNPHEHPVSNDESTHRRQGDRVMVCGQDPDGNTYRTATVVEVRDGQILLPLAVCVSLLWAGRRGFCNPPQALSAGVLPTQEGVCTASDAMSSSVRVCSAIEIVALPDDTSHRVTSVHFYS